MSLFTKLNPSSSIKLFNSTLKARHIVIVRKINIDTNDSVIPLTTWQRKKEEFENTLHEFITDMASEPTVAEVPLAKQRLKDVLQHSLEGGKRNRAMFILFAQEMLAKPEHSTPENMKICQLLGWFSEIIQAVGNIVDDIIDDSKTRRGLPCWHLVPGIGIHAVNDVYLIMFSMLLLLRRHMENKPYYNNVMHIGHEVILQSIMGQHVDLKTNINMKLDLFNADMYRQTCKLKAGYHTFALPICWVLYINNYDQSEHKQVKDIAAELGYLYQMQNDFLDCYGEAETGKVSSDIRNGSATWLAIKAMELANPSQRAMLRTYYGSTDPEHTQWVKNLYDTLELPKLFREEERAECEKVLKMSQAMPPAFQILYANIVQRINKRNL